VEAKAVLRELVAELGEQQFELRFVDVVENLDHAVEVGVLATPALAVNGELICSSLPGKRKLRKLLMQQIARATGRHSHS
jgi:hypothetical protein